MRSKIPVMTSSRPTVPGLPLTEVRRLLDDAAAFVAAGSGSPVTVAVVDATGELQGLLRGDGAFPMTARLAHGKARTALLTVMPSRDAAGLPGPLLGALQSLYGGEYVAVDGGRPLVDGTALLGGIGVSGASSEEDDAAAAAAVDAWQARR
jgi:uncharacterized protein GlcG (DUF336 family)